MTRRGAGGGSSARTRIADPPSNSGPDRSYYNYSKAKATFSVKGHAVGADGSSMSACSKVIVVMSMALGLLLLLNQDAANGILSWGNDNVKPAATAAVNTAANKLSSVRRPNDKSVPASAPSLRGEQQPKLNTQQAGIPHAVPPVPQKEAPKAQVPAPVPKPVPVVPPPKPAPKAQPAPAPKQEAKAQPAPLPKPAPVPAPEPHYEVWSRLKTQEEKSKAMDRVLSYVRNLKNYIPANSGGVWRRKPSDKGIVGPCKLVPMGRGTVQREVCDVQAIVPEGEQCHFLSFGTSAEHSFETDMALKEGCNGYTVDPSWDHKSSMDKLVKYGTFSFCPLVN